MVTSVLNRGLDLPDRTVNRPHCLIRVCVRLATRGAGHQGADS